MARYDAILTRLDEESARHAERLARLDQAIERIDLTLTRLERMTQQSENGRDA